MKVHYAIVGMSCPNCAILLESIEDDLPGIKEINASYRKQELHVEFDENLVTVAEIIEKINKKGYQIQPTG